MNIINNVEEFEKLVKEDKVVVDFYADWCGPCRMISPILEKLEKEGLFKLVKVNTDDFPDLAKEFGVMTIPNIKLFEKGILKKSNIGMMNEEEIKNFIK